MAKGVKFDVQYLLQLRRRKKSSSSKEKRRQKLQSSKLVTFIGNALVGVAALTGILVVMTSVILLASGFPG